MSHDTALTVSNMFFDKTLISIVQKLISDMIQSLLHTRFMILFTLN